MRFLLVSLMLALVTVGCGDSGGGGVGDDDIERPCSLATTGAITVDDVPCGNATAMEARTEYVVILANDGAVAPVTFQAAVTFTSIPEETTYQLSGFTAVIAEIADDETAYANLEDTVMTVELSDVEPLNTPTTTVYLLHGELRGTLDNPLVGDTVAISATF